MKIVQIAMCICDTCMHSCRRSPAAALRFTSGYNIINTSTHK